MNKFTTLILALLLTCTASTASTALADEFSFLSPITVRASGNYISGADYKDSDASSSVAGGRVRLNAGGFSLSYEGKHYSWDNVDQLSFGNGNDDPWNTLHRISVGYTHNGAINKNWFYGAGITGTSAFEKEISGSFGGAVRGHVGYIFNKNWKAIIGARGFVNSLRFSAMPYAGLMYEDFDDQGAGFFMNVGLPSNEAGYAFSKTSKIRASFKVDGKTYRLKDDSSVAQEGYVEISSMVAGIYYDWKPFKGFSLSLGPEYYFSRETKTYDKHGDRFGDITEQDSALGGTLSFKYSF